MKMNRRAFFERMATVAAGAYEARDLAKWSLKEDVATAKLARGDDLKYCAYVLPYWQRPDYREYAWADALKQVDMP